MEPVGSLTPTGAFAFLLGSWRVTREVSGMATMVGTIDVQQCGENVAEYVERMLVRTEAGAGFAGSLRYTVRRMSGGFDLEFAETGKLFQRVAFSFEEGCGLQGEAVHDCGEDRYESLYVLGPGREMMVRHLVEGPRKAYVSVARCVVDGERLRSAEGGVSCSGERSAGR